MYKILYSIIVITLLFGCSKPKDDATAYTHSVIELNKTGEFILSGEGITLGKIETPAIVIERKGTKKYYLTISLKIKY